MLTRFADPEYQKWAKEVKIRDGYRCQVCSRRGGPIHAHHMNAWASFPEQRYELKNGVTLCTTCHDKFHSVFGKGENTVFQFLQFKKLYLLIKQSYIQQYEENLTLSGIEEYEKHEKQSSDWEPDEDFNFD